MNEPPNSDSPRVPPESPVPGPPEAPPPPPPAGLPAPLAEGAPPAPPPVQFGGFWIRFAAYIIDGLVLAAVALPIGFIYGFIYGFLPLEGQDPYALGASLGAGLITFVVYVAYFVGFWARGGATLGMRLLGLQVVRDADGGPITVGKAGIRYVGFVISALVLYIGLIWAAFDSRKRGWHDLMAGTVVIRRPDVPVTGGRRVLMWGAIGCGCLLPILAIAGVVTLLFLGPIVQDIFGRQALDLARGPDGQVTVPVQANLYVLQVGDCFDLIEESLTDVQVIPCAEGHTFEVFFTGDMPDGEYPGDDAVTSFAEDQCVPAFEDYVGISFQESVWYATQAGPDETSWAGGQRTVMCVLHNQSATAVTGSARGTAQ